MYQVSTNLGCCTCKKKKKCPLKLYLKLKEFIHVKDTKYLYLHNLIQVTFFVRFCCKQHATYEATRKYHPPLYDLKYNGKHRQAYKNLLV